MSKQILEKRVEYLERTLSSLAELPAQVRDLSSQFLQLRIDVRADISAVNLRVDGLANQVGGLRGEVGELRGEVGELRRDGAQRSELYAVRDELRGDMAAMHKELAGAIVANGVEMRTLHEGLVRRISLLGEGLPRRDGSAQ